MDFENHLNSQLSSITNALSSINKINTIYLSNSSIKVFQDSLNKLNLDIKNSMNSHSSTLSKINEQNLKSINRFNKILLNNTQQIQDTMKAYYDSLNRINEQNLKNLNRFNEIISNNSKQMQNNMKLYDNFLNKDLIINSLNLISESIPDIGSSILSNEEISETQSEINEITDTLSNEQESKVDIHTWANTIYIIFSILKMIYDGLNQSQCCCNHPQNYLPTEIEIQQQETLEKISSYLDELINNIDVNNE